MNRRSFFGLLVALPLAVKFIARREAFLSENERKLLRLLEQQCKHAVAALKQEIERDFYGYNGSSRTNISSPANHKITGYYATIEVKR